MHPTILAVFARNGKILIILYFHKYLKLRKFVESHHRSKYSS